MRPPASCCCCKSFRIWSSTMGGRELVDDEAVTLVVGACGKDESGRDSGVVLLIPPAFVAVDDIDDMSFY
jgi:hypothetical protein